jgi:hypothetical protein
LVYVCPRCQTYWQRTGETGLRIGDNAYLYGGFLEPPTGNNVIITEYVWDFGNGATKTLPANSTSLNPTHNPATATYTQPGLYPVTLTLVTENSTSMTTYRTSIEQTVAVGSSFQPYTVFLYAGSVPNPSVISVAEFLPGGAITFDPALSRTRLVSKSSSTYSARCSLGMVHQQRTSSQWRQRRFLRYRMEKSPQTTRPTRSR